MTEQLQNAFDAAAELPETDQDRIAAWLLAEIRDERQWDARFAGSQALLEKMAGDAIAEHRAGETLPLDDDSA